MSEPIDIARDLYQAFGRGDIPAVLGALTPGCEWTEAAGGPYGGVYIGPDAVLEGVFQKLGGEWDGFAAVPHEFVADGDRVVVLGDYSATYKQTGKSFTAPFAHVWKFNEGKVVSFQQYVDTVLHMAPLQ